jgi:hypothetical protein
VSPTRLQPQYGITETDGYDADGNRLSISSTGGVSGTALVTNTWDQADGLTSSTTVERRPFA